MKTLKRKEIEILLMELVIIIVTILLHKFYDSGKLLIIIGSFIGLINLLRLKFDRLINKIINLIIDKRYLVALVIFIFCLIFKLHGSSIGIWNNMFTQYNKDENSVLLGESRDIRSDEWVVHTSYYISQTYNNFALNSNSLSYSGQNMIIGYNAPVLDITLIGKPFTLGYIIFGSEYGLSWYWCMKLILLVLLSYELGIIITKGNKKISVLGSFLIAFGPSMQWWFVPHMCDVFFWAMAIVVVLYNFFMAKKKYIKNIMTLLAPSVCIGFVLALFPSLQVPLGIIAALMLLVFLFRDRLEITFKKKDILRIIFIVLVVVIVLAYFLYTSFDALKLLSETVYPGSRMEQGGNMFISDLFTDLTTIFLPFKQITYSNLCEVSTFIHFGPFFMALFPFMYFKLRKTKDNNLGIGLLLFIILLVQIIFMIFGFPLWLAKITLFSYINRMKIVYGFVAILFTLWSISTLWKNRNMISKYILFGFILIYGLVNYNMISSIQLSYLSINYYIAEILLLLLVLFFICFRKKNYALFSLITLIVISGFTINPIATGLSPYYNHKISDWISNIVKEDDSKWLAICQSPASSFLLANGANVMNAVNFYPDFEKWKIIDPDHKYMDMYNRYAHIEMHLTTNDTTITLNSADSIKVMMNYNTLEKLEIKYLFTNEELNNNLDNINFKLLYDDTSSGYKIYEVIYK